MIRQAPPRLRASASAILSSVLVFACASIQAQSPEKLLKDGEAYDLKLEAAKALATYQELEKIEPTNADVKVRIARQYRHLMADAPNTGDKLELGTKALDYGRKAAALAPSNSDAQLSCAISYGKMLPLFSSREQMTTSKLIKEGAEKAIKLKSSNDLAWHILGRWHRGVASVGSVKRALASMVYERLPTASNEEAIACFEKAAKLNPNRMMHQIELGRTYAQLGMKDEAKRVLQKGCSMPELEKEDAQLKSEGKQLLASLR
ncbi:MAG: hypothetical protein ACAI34_08700 [Verrucomicrobium sp.]